MGEVLDRVQIVVKVKVIKYSKNGRSENEKREIIQPYQEGF